MSELDFHVEFNIEVPNFETNLKIESEQRLRVLTENRNDFIGASISVEEIAGIDDSYLYQARIVTYLKPENIAVVVKRETAETALRDALTTIEDRIRADRDKRRNVWQQPKKRSQLSLQELSIEEIHDTYVDDVISKELIDQGRDKIAAKLMLEENLDQNSAYYAADCILEYANRNSAR
jgi:hypothetical protein